MGKSLRQKLLCMLYDKKGLDRWVTQCKRSCDEVNAFFDGGKKKKKR